LWGENIRKGEAPPPEISCEWLKLKRIRNTCEKLENGIKEKKGDLTANFFLKRTFFPVKISFKFNS